MDSSRTHDSSNDDNIIADNTTNVNIANTASTVETPNESLDEVPPPPYPTDSNVNTPTPSHSRDHTTTTLTSLPEYTTVITTQPQPKVMSLPSNHSNRLSDLSITAEDAPILDSSLQLKFCKICQEPEESGSSTSRDEENFVAEPETYIKGKLISPCKCKGSLQYVHIGCLNKWRHSNVRLEASYRCEVCKYEYRFYRPRIAKIFSSSLTLHILSLTLLLSTIYLSSYIAKLLIKYNNDIKDPNNDPPPPHLPGQDKNKWLDNTFLNIRLIEYIIGLSIISIFGLIFFITMICCNGFSHTRHNFCYCGGCGCNCSGYSYGCVGSDCSGSGDCGGILIIFSFLIIAVIFMLGFFGAIIAAYLSIQKITTICLEKVHDRILEVKKD